MPEWEPLKAAARARGADVGDAAIAALPFAIEFSDDVLALHGSRDRSGQ